MISGWPVYLLFAVLLTGMVILYRQHLSKHGNESLPELITKNLEGRDQTFQSLDDVINSRKTWEPVLAKWQDRILPDLTYAKSNGEIGKLSDLEGKQIILVIGATWYPPFRMQLTEFQGFTNAPENQTPVIIGVTAESPHTNQRFIRNNACPFEIASVDFLPEPYSVPEGFPILFFINSEGQLKLAAVGLIPLAQAQAIVTLPLPK